MVVGEPPEHWFGGVIRPIIEGVSQTRNDLTGAHLDPRVLYSGSIESNVVFFCSTIDCCVALCAVSPCALKGCWTHVQRGDEDADIGA